MIVSQPNYPDFAEREAQLVAEIAAWYAMAEVERITLDKHRGLLKRMLATLPRRASPCRLAAKRCRSLRIEIRRSLQLVASIELHLAYLRCDEPLPF
ncbi:hypothetical protein [Aeromonas jandaei]|uniref:hypothetical protein n=1 Tax=Aeromonas jandaei TaxID=650 RepID=UPI001ADDC1E3|nr:hypothetical protein [Aeromonas jandaei]QTL95553.1 hypothetical protein AjGTCBM29_03472 [Aeromonas jandaei]